MTETVEDPLSINNDLVGQILERLQKGQSESSRPSGGENHQLLSLLEDISTVAEIEGLGEAANTALDRIEKQINDEVNDKSEAFFSACANLKKLNDTVAAIHQTSETIHSMVREMESKSAEMKSKLDTATVDHEALLETKKKLQLIHEFVNGQELIQSLLDTHAFTDALRVIEQKIKFAKEELAGIEAIVPMQVELEEMKTALTKMLASSGDSDLPGQ